MQKGRGFCSCDTYIIIMVFILVFMGQPLLFFRIYSVAQAAIKIQQVSSK